MPNRKSLPRSTIIFDASNFYFKLKSLEIEHKSHFDYLKFSQWVASGSKLTKKFYAVGEYRAKPTDKKEIRETMAKQQELLARLEKDGFVTQLGYLLKTGGVYHEKGVDVQLAVDIMKGAYRDTYDICYLVSSDTDLIPAIKEARSVGKKVVYVGFRHQVSYALNNQCDQSRLLTKSDILQFI